MNLTRYTLFTTLFILFSNLAFAQSSIGLKAGVNLADWNYRYEGGAISEDYTINYGYQFGVAVDLRLSQKLSLLTEFLYIQKGAKAQFRQEFISFNNDIRYRLFYYEVPILLKVNFIDQSDTNFYFLLGPSFGYTNRGELYHAFTSDGETQVNVDEFEFAKDDELNQFEFSAVFGAGVAIPAGKGSLILEARYLYGISNFLDYGIESKSTLRNVGLGTYIGYMLPLTFKKKGK